MAATVKTLVQAASVAARNQQAAQASNQATAAAIAAQRGPGGRGGPIPADAQKAGGS